jgi:predicted phage-related endonuclease
VSETDWLEWRRQGLGSSDAPMACGLSTYGGPLTLWATKKGLRPETEQTAEQEFGHRWEAVAGPWTAEREGVHLLGEQTWCHHPVDAWKRATVDAFYAETPDASMDEIAGIVEHKSYCPVADGEIRPDVLVQVLWQLHVTGLPEAIVTGLVGKHFITRRVRAKDYPEDMAWVVETCEAFWRDHVLVDVEPTATAADLEYLGLVVPEVPGVAVELSTEVADTLATYRALKAQAKAIDTQIKTARALIEQALGTAAIGTVAGQIACTWKGGTRKDIDTKALAEELPDVAARHRRTSTTRTFRLAKEI